MKRNLILALRILTLSLAVPLLISTCTTISLVSYLVLLNLDTDAGRTTQDSGPVRIRTLPDLSPDSPAPVTYESEPDLAGVIEDVVPESAAAAEMSPVVEVPAKFATSESASDAEMPTGSLPDEEPTMAPETTTQTESEEAVEAVSSQPQEEASPVEELPVVEIPVEPAPSGRPLPEIAANPVPPSQKEPPAPTAPPESTFVPDSSFFDQLLEQVE